MFRSPVELAALKRYLLPDEMRDHVLSCFARGFISHFEYAAPEPWGHVDNYDPLRDGRGSELLRSRMKEEVLAGRMIGGPG